MKLRVKQYNPHKVTPLAQLMLTWARQEGGGSNDGRRCINL